MRTRRFRPLRPRRRGNRRRRLTCSRRRPIRATTTGGTTTTERLVLLGFLPWRDESRQVDVRENPSALVAERCAAALGGLFIPVPVSGEGISRAMEALRVAAPDLVVALGQTSTEPRVESRGRVPGAWAPAGPDEETPWLLTSDAAPLAARLNELADPSAELAPVRASDDAGGYFCDHLCVELVREARRRPMAARFLHLTAIDGCAPRVRDARLRQYVRQVHAVVEWLSGRG